MTASSDLGTPSTHGGLVLGGEVAWLISFPPASVTTQLLGFGGFIGYRLQASPKVAFIGRAGLQGYLLNVSPDVGEDSWDLSGNLVLGADAHLGWFLVGLESWVGESTNFMFRIGVNWKQVKK